MKPCSPKMEAISDVNDGSTGEIRKGYFVVEATVFSKNKKMPLPVYEKVFSATEKGFMLKKYFDIIKKNVYNIKIDSKQEDWCMTISEQIKVLCVRCGVSEAELARRLGKSPQSFNSKMKRESFTVEDLEKIADVLDVEFNREFILANGDKV